MRRPALTSLALLAAATSGCTLSVSSAQPSDGTRGPETSTPRTPPTPPTPRTRPTSRKSPTPRPTPTTTRLAWRTETLSDGSQLLVVGDVDAVPWDPAAISSADYRPAEETGEVKVVKVRGWWCTTRVEARLSLSGGFLRNAGFATRCSGRPGAMRQYYRFERSSWTGMRVYTGDRTTPWTRHQTQAAGMLSAPCPAGRTGTYDYRVRVVLEIKGLPAGEVPALSDDRFRGDCGTGAS